MTLPTESFIPTRYSLLSRLQNRDDRDSWKDFFDTYWRLIYSTAIKAGLTDAEAQDVVQETIICVANDIEKFKRDETLGSFKGWLRNLTRWRIADQLRRRGPAASNRRLTDLEEIGESAGPELEKVWEEEWQTNLMTAAAERVKHRIREEHYQIFDLNVAQQWSAAKVAKTLGINIAHVYLAKHRVLALIKKEIRLLERNGEKRNRKM